MLVKYLLGEVSDTEKVQVQHWIKESDEHKKYFYDLKLIWNQSRNIAVASTITTDDAWARFTHRRDQAPAAPRSISLPASNYKWLRIAAGLLLLAGGSWLTWFITRQTVVEAPPVAYYKAELPTTTPPPTVDQPDLANADKPAPAENKAITTLPKPVAGKTTMAKKSVSAPGNTAAQTQTQTPTTVSADNASNAYSMSESAHRSVEPAPATTADVAYRVADKPADDRYTHESLLKSKAIVTTRKSVASRKSMAPSQMMYNTSAGGQQKSICNGTACPLEICITQSVKCHDGKPAAYSTCSTLEPDESGQIGLKMFGKMGQNCDLTVQEIKITLVSTGETIILNESSQPATAQDVYNYITGKTRGTTLAAGEFHSDCRNDGMGHTLKFDNNNYGHLILQ